MALSGVRHIFFDLDHTLWDFETNSSKAIAQLYQTHDLSGIGVANLPRFLEHYKVVNHAAWDKYRNGLMTKSVLRVIRFEKTLQAFGVNDEALALQMADAYLEISPYQKTLMPGTLEILDYLKGKYALHIITNGFEEVQHIKLRESGLAPYFDAVITSEQVNARKPSPLIFEHSLVKTGAKTEESLIIGDNLEADILGGKLAGWKQVYYNPEKIPHQEEMTVEIDDLLALKNWL